MKVTLSSCLIILMFSATTVANAYTPKLVLLEDNTGYSQIYFDENSKKKVAKDIMQVMIYEKYTKPTTDEYTGIYQSAIKKMLIDCQYFAVAEGAAKYYSGRTSNSELVSGYDDTVSRNGYTGVTSYAYDDLDYASIKGSSFNTKLFNAVCKSK